VGDVVYHKTAEEKIEGIVTAVRLVEVDWGPDRVTSVHHENTLTDKFTPKFGD
jgi:hypothetical protein